MLCVLDIFSILRQVKVQAAGSAGSASSNPGRCEHLGSLLELSPSLGQSPKMSNRVKRDVRLEVAPGALGVTFEADYNGCAGKFFQHTHQMHDKNDLRFFNCVTSPLLLTQFYFLLQCIQPSSNDL